MSPNPTLSSIDLNLPGYYSGKVRESWSIPDGRKILVTTDRLSSFDRIIGLVENKGQVLNQLAAWWFETTRDIVANHLLETPDPNVSIVKEVVPLPIEVVLRSRLTGSTSTALLPRYLAGERKMYGYELPDGLEPHGQLPEVLLTPTTKAQDGQHDSPITVDEVVERGLVDPQVWTETQKVAHQLFSRGTEIAERKGFVLADTKYEFGLTEDNELLLIDEVHTPDSSRYWLAETLEERLSQGQAPDGFDKEPVRLALRAAGYSGDGEVPDLGDEVWRMASDRFVHIYEALTGLTFEPGERPIEDRIKRSLSSFTNGGG